MDYAKLYDNFILDRIEKSKNLKVSDYVEIHNIFRDEEKIVKLKPEDYFFAHLLLAKAYGEEHWSNLHKILNRGNRSEIIKYKDFANKRKQFGFIRRLSSNSFRKKKISRNENIYVFKNKDGRFAEGNKEEIRIVTGLKIKSINKLINGNIKTSFGWYYPSLNPTGISQKELSKLEREADLETFTLFHFDGRTWSGNKMEFEKDHGKKLIFQTEEGMCHGWFRKKELAEEFLLRRVNSQNSNLKFFQFKNSNTGEIFYNSKAGLAKQLNTTKAKVNELLVGKIGQLKGIKAFPNDKRKKRVRSSENVYDLSFSTKRPNRSYYRFKFLDNGETYKLSIPEMSEKFNIPTRRLYHLVAGETKVLKKYGVVMA